MGQMTNKLKALYLLPEHNWHLIYGPEEHRDIAAQVELITTTQIEPTQLPTWHGQDYVRELTARVRAVLRRGQKTAQESDLLRVSDIELDRSSVTVKVSGQSVDLTKSEFQLLAAMMSAPGKVFSRLDLLDHVSGEAYEGYERTIDVHIRNLRIKIEPDSKNPKYIETVYGMGYRFAKRS